jgi:nucleoside-diphosphate-sugar epimerase
MISHVLVTGGAGDMGSILYEHLLGAGYQSITVNNFWWEH